MKTMQKAVGALAALATVSGVGLARANITICNNTPHQISVATGFFGDYDGIGCNWYHDQQTGLEDVEWKSWWNIDAGVCAQVFPSYPQTDSCYTSGDMLYWAIDWTNGDYWAGAGKNGAWNPIYSSYHWSRCCHESTPNPNATYGQSWPGLDTCAPDGYPDDVIAYGPRYDGLTRYSVCAQDHTLFLYE